MRTIKYIFLLLAFVVCQQVHSYYDYKKRSRAVPAAERKNSKQVQPKIISAPNCKSAASCVDDPNCFCYCSEVCHYRKKFKSDKPVFVAGDRVEIDAETGEEYVIPAGCYCKQWDLDVYTNNCKKYLGRKSMHIGRDMRRIKDKKLKH